MCQLMHLASESVLADCWPFTVLPAPAYITTLPPKRSHGGLVTFPAQAGLVCTVRDSRGDDEMAACGQLGAPEQFGKTPPLLQPPPHLQDALLAAV